MLKALQDRYIVEPIEEEKKSDTWVILETRTEKPIRGRIVGVGPGRTLESWWREHMDVNVWDIIYFAKYWPDEFYHEDKKYFSIKQSTILAVYSKD